MPGRPRSTRVARVLEFGMGLASGLLLALPRCRPHGSRSLHLPCSWASSCLASIASLRCPRSTPVPGNRHPGACLRTPAGLAVHVGPTGRSAFVFALVQVFVSLLCDVILAMTSHEADWHVRAAQQPSNVVRARSAMPKRLRNQNNLSPSFTSLFLLPQTLVVARSLEKETRLP